MESLRVTDNLSRAALAEPENFAAGLGEKYGREDALRRMRLLEAYALRERMTAAA